MASGEKIIGIDLGTTNSVVAVMEGSEVKVIPNAEMVMLANSGHACLLETDVDLCPIQSLRHEERCPRGVQCAVAREMEVCVFLHAARAGL